MTQADPPGGDAVSVWLHDTPRVPDIRCPVCKWPVLRDVRRFGDVAHQDCAAKMTAEAVAAVIAQQVRRPQ